MHHTCCSPCVSNFVHSCGSKMGQKQEWWGLLLFRGSFIFCCGVSSPLTLMYESDKWDNLPFFIHLSVLGFVHIRICFSIFQERVKTCKLQQLAWNWSSSCQILVLFSGRRKMRQVTLLFLWFIYNLSVWFLENIISSRNVLPVN